MEFEIERTEFLNGLSMVQGIVERRNTVPILSHVMLRVGEELELLATDLEVGISTKLRCEASGSGSLTLGARKLFEVVREGAADKVSVKTLENDAVEVKCGRARFKMPGLDPRSFPAMPSSNGEGKAAAPLGKLSIKAEMLATMIDRTIFAVSPDEARYNLSGVYLEAPETDKARMVATDGHRLALIEREVKGFSTKHGVIIPRKGLNEVRKLLERGQGEEEEVELMLYEQLASLQRGETQVSMRLVEGEFPDYRGVLPKESRYQIAIGRDVLLAAIKRAAIFSNERYHGIKLAFSSGELTVSSTSPEMGEASETLDVVFNGEAFSVGFNASYVQQVLGVIPEGDAILGLTDEVSPGVVTAESKNGDESDSGFKYVVMPMRL